jgi:glycosyltransferase involved in cell wall biosynthesis
VALRVPPQPVVVPYAISPRLELSGVVYTSILNPFDPRKNWTDLLTAFLLALRNRDDATLVIKLVAPPQYTAQALNGMLGYYKSLGFRHRCRVAFVPGYLSDAQMVELTRATTYYVNSARAEGACLPLQDFLAAGRPGVAPLHTALTDYFDDGIGFVVASHPEPTCWPHDPSQRPTTFWHRLVWQSLHDELAASYEVARQAPDHYRALSQRGREQMAGYASAEEVWPRLLDALGSVSKQCRPSVELPPVHEPVRIAS